MRRDDLGNRLRRSAWKPIPSESRRRHQAAIDDAVRNHLPTESHTYSRRRLVAIALVASLAMLPAGIAIAAESSVPGDLLFPVKRATEAVRALMDSDIAAEHRVEELERLLLRDSAEDVLAAQVDRAQVEVDALDRDHVLRPRLSTLVAAVDDPAKRKELRDDIIAGDSGRILDRSTTTVGRDRATTTTVTDRATGSTTSAVPVGTIGDATDDTFSTTVPRESTTTTVPETPATTAVVDDAGAVVGYVHAGPTCPVQRFPPDPDCEDRPVMGAILIIRTPEGDEVARVESGEEGRFRLRLPRGTYSIEPQPVDGLLGTAPSQEFEVGLEALELDIAYDTGIR